MKVFRKFFNLDTSIMELWSSFALIILAIYSIVDPLPKNMIDFQMMRLWVIEMLIFSGLSIWTVLYHPTTFLRTWLAFIGSLFWFYYTISIIGVHESLTVIVSSLLSASLAISFLQQSSEWPDQK